MPPLCEKCRAALPVGARVCPLCGTPRPDDVPDTLRASSEPALPQRKFPRALYRAGLWALGFDVALLMVTLFGTFFGGWLIWFVLLALLGEWLWLLLALSIIFGFVVVLTAHFGPWPLGD